MHLKMVMQSQLFASHTRTVASDEALMTCVGKKGSHVQHAVPFVCQLSKFLPSPQATFTWLPSAE